MKSLNSFLTPKRKENLKFVLSTAFTDEETGRPLEWEMRQLSAHEGLELQKKVNAANYPEVMTAYVAEALVYPNLRDAELLKALGDRKGSPVLRPADALVEIVNDAELGELISRYAAFNDLNTGISGLVDEAKN